MTKAINTTKVSAHTVLIENAKAKGYTVKATYVECKGCKETIEAYMRAHGLDTVPIYMNAKTAIKFTKKGHPDIIACPDGHRTVVPKRAYKESSKCKNYGLDLGDRVCHSCIGQKEIEENGGYCYKCRPIDRSAQPAVKKERSPNMGYAPEVSMCKTKGCNNPLPKDRKSYCYECRPKAAAPKENQEGAQKVVM
jgi:hypothetical protein